MSGCQQVELILTCGPRAIDHVMIVDNDSHELYLTGDMVMQRPVSLLSDRLWPNQQIWTRKKKTKKTLNILELPIVYFWAACIMY